MRPPLLFGLNFISKTFRSRGFKVFQVLALLMKKAEQRGEDQVEGKASTGSENFNFGYWQNKPHQIQNTAHDYENGGKLV